MADTVFIQLTDGALISWIRKKSPLKLCIYDKKWINYMYNIKIWKDNKLWAV